MSAEGEVPDEEHPRILFLTPGGVVDEEGMRAAHERGHMQVEDFSNSLRSLLFEELTLDQLATLQQVMRFVSNTPQRVRALAAWYEGLVDAAWLYRQSEGAGVDGPAPVPVPTAECHPFTPDADELVPLPCCVWKPDEEAAMFCAKQPDDEVHSRWAGAVAGPAQ